jgi:hypothetical protein
MMKQIRDRSGASFHFDMSGLSAHIVVHVQLTCESGMTLTRLTDVTSSVQIWTLPLMLYVVSNYPVYGLCICVLLNVWTMC